jgi:hypothetical protein
MLQRFALSLILGGIIGLFLSSFVFRAPNGILLRGDFPAFYAAAKLSLSGRGQELYEASSTAALEQEAWPDLGSDYLPFAYPPFVALLLSPLALFPPLWAKFIFTALTFASAVFALTITLRLAQVPRQYRFSLTVIALSFPPFLSGVLAGQNTAFSLLILSALLYVELRVSGLRRDYFTGALFGLWFFKPHFAVFSLLFFLFSASTFSARFRILLATSAVAVLQYLLGALLLGFSWPVIWLNAVRHFSSLDAQANIHQMISFWGLAEVFGGSQLSFSFAAVASALVFSAGVYRCYLVAEARCGEDRSRLYALLLLAPLLVLIAPHVLYYELGLCVMPLLYLSRRSVAKVSSFFLLLWFCALPFVLLKAQLAFQPLFIFAALVFFTVLFWPLVPEKPHIQIEY